MRQLTLALDVLPALREFAAAECDLGAACALAELACVDAVRLGLSEDLHPVRESDVHALRKSARGLELRMPATPSLLKVALEARPDLVVLAAEGWEGDRAAGPIDLRVDGGSLAAGVRTLREAGIEVAAVVAPDLEPVKAAHGIGAVGVELYTGSLLDLPPPERGRELERLGDAARLAAKLKLRVAIGGKLGYRTLPEVLGAAPSVERVVAGRSVLSRAQLVGLDRAIRDFRALLAG